MKEDIIKIEDNNKNMNKNISNNNNIFVSEKFNFPQKDNEHIEKKKIKCLSIKRKFFKVKNITECNKKKIYSKSS